MRGMNLINSEKPIETLSFDHISPMVDNSIPAAVLYFDPSSDSSTSLLSYLQVHATGYPSFRYVVRYKPSQSLKTRLQGRKSALSGYGVELALKNTDYLVVDDRDTGSAKGGSAQTPLVVGEQGSSEGPFATVLGSDPWSELSTPLRPTEVAGELLMVQLRIQPQTHSFRHRCSSCFAHHGVFGSP
jgi:UDP-glucose:glycoprotein glucosyltransferase